MTTFTTSGYNISGLWAMGIQSFLRIVDIKRKMKMGKRYETGTFQGEAAHFSNRCQEAATVVAKQSIFPNNYALLHHAVIIWNHAQFHLCVGPIN